MAENDTSRPDSPPPSEPQASESAGATHDASPEPAPILADIEIVIGDDGEVIFTDLPAELLDVALALDPDSDLACRLPESNQPAAEESSDSSEPSAD